jgi:hypothetical protein
MKAMGNDKKRKAADSDEESSDSKGSDNWSEGDSD